MLDDKEREELHNGREEGENMEQVIFNDTMQVLADFMPFFMVLAAICFADYATNFLLDLLKKGRDRFV